MLVVVIQNYKSSVLSVVCPRYFLLFKVKFIYFGRLTTLILLYSLLGNCFEPTFI